MFYLRYCLFCRVQVQSLEPARGVLDGVESSSDISDILREFGFANESPDVCAPSDSSIGEWSDCLSFMEEQQRGLEKFNKSKYSFYSGSCSRHTKIISSRPRSSHGRVKMSRKKRKPSTEAGPSTAAPSEVARSDLPPPPPDFSLEEWTKVYPGLNELRHFVKQEPDL